MVESTSIICCKLGGLYKRGVVNMGSCKLRVVQKEIVQKGLYKRGVINMGGCTKGELSKGVDSKEESSNGGILR